MYHHTGENGFKCTMCDKEYNRRSRLTLHMKFVHENDHSVICDICQKAFRRKDDLVRHMEVHNRTKGMDFI